MADHRRHSLPGTTAMNVSVAASHRPLHRPEIGSRRIDHRFTKGDPARLVADRGRVDIPVLTIEKHAKADTEGFLSSSQVDPANHLAGTIEGPELVLEETSSKHQAERFDKGRGLNG